MFSSKVYKINPEFRKDFIGLLEKSKKGVKYSEVKIGGKKEPLSMTIKNIGEIRKGASKIGEKYKVALDYNYPIADRNGRTHNIILNNQFEICTFDSKDISDFVVVFASRGNANSFVDILDDLIKKENCISQIAFKLSENEQKLRQEFPDIKQFHIEKIQDSFIHYTLAGGDQLGLSNEYAKYTRLGGTIKSLMINFNGVFIIISTDGVIWSRRKTEKEDLLVYDILNKLNGYKVFQYQSKLP